jgi:hypothetical protein
MVDKDIVYGLVLSFAIWLLPIFIRKFRSDWRMMLTYWFVIALHQAVAFINLYLFPMFFARQDALTYHQVAGRMAQYGTYEHTVSNTYVNILGSLYWFFGPSIMLGQQLSILAFAISFLILVKLLFILEEHRYRIFILLFYGALPSMVLISSVTLRESFQILFFMLTFYFAIKMHLKQGMNIYLVAFFISALVMGCFHKALIIYAPFLIILFMWWTMKPTSNLFSIKKLRLALVCIIPVLFLGVIFIMKTGFGGSALVKLTNLNIFEAIHVYREGTPITRATYGISLDTSSIFNIIYSSFILYLNYLFAPFPWSIENILDLYASMEAIIRMILIYYSVKHWHNSYGTKKRVLGLMLILFFSVSFMWATGTTNYGTAIRHNLLGWWIIVVAGLPPLLERVIPMIKTLIIPRKPHSLRTD